MHALIAQARRFWGAMLAIAAVCGILSAVACGCSLFQQGPNGPQISARSIARGSVETLETVWIMSAKGCLTVAEIRDDDAIRQKCEKVLMPVRDGLVAAAAAIDAWGAAEQKEMPCLLRDVAASFDAVSSLLKDLGVDVPEELPQGLELAQALIPQCTDDGGVTVPAAAKTSAADQPAADEHAAEVVIDAVTGDGGGE